MQVRDYLDSSGLLLEGVEKLGITSAINCYCGFNVTKTDNEPIDQIQSFIAARRIQEYNMAKFDEEGQFIAFIGGLFEVLNCKNADELEALIKKNGPKERSKKRLFEGLCELYDINALVLTTEDLWQDTVYWEILKNFFDTKVFVRGDLINDVLAFYENIAQLMAALRVKQLPASLVNLPLEFIKRIGNFPAPILYTPAEVTEAFYLQRKYGVTMKIGQAQERTYDKYLYNDLSVFRLRQPVSLGSTLARPETVTPYIDKASFEQSGTRKAEARIYFADSKREIAEKVSQLKPQNYVYTVDSVYGEVLNPLVEKAIFAIESARAMNLSPVIIGSVELSSGQELIDAILDNKLAMESIQELLPSLLYEYITKPLENKL